jgi:hypothetical protein
LHPASYFEAAAGFPPLPFQLAWMEQAEASPIRTLEAPTGLGKTLATLAGWLWDRQQRPQTTPRRLVYQLPLRTLTEQIAVECRAVMARLGIAIPVHVLRGGQIDNDYADALAAEAVIVGTLDQVVSRQLMRGYCCSRRSWPRHFAALNTDVRVVVDETQLQGAAVRTAIHLQQLHQELGGPAPRELVLCSATLDAAILPAGPPPPWPERCRLRTSGGSTEGGPHQAAHHRDRWEQLLLTGRPEEAMEVALGGEGGWPTLKPELFAALDGVGCQIGFSGSRAGLSVRPAAPARRWGRGARRWGECRTSRAQEDPGPQRPGARGSGPQAGTGTGRRGGRGCCRLPSVSDGAMTTLVGGLALPGALGSQSHVRRDTAPGYWRVHAADGNRKELR